MDYKGIVFFDYDGTLSDEKEGIFYPTKKTVEAVNALSADGFLTVLATGRSKCYAPKTDINFGGIISTNGGYAEIMGKTLFENEIPKGDIKAFSKRCDELGIFYSYENQEKCFAKSLYEPVFYNMLKNFNIPTEVFYPIEEGCEKGISKLLIAHADTSLFDILQKEFCDSLVIEIHRSYTSADVSMKGVSKGTAAQKMAEHLNIPKDRLYAFGDGVNDIELFRSVGHAVAMGRHADILDEYAEFVTETVKNEGIAKGLVRLGLTKR